MSSILAEPLRDLFFNSKELILDFSKIPHSTPKLEDISIFFSESKSIGIDPKLPENRQNFNNRVLESSGFRYLVSGYLENRGSMIEGSEIMNEGRYLHLGIDIFSKNLETIYSPCDGRIVEIGLEPEDHSFGNYLILQPNDQTLPYIFFGHLDSSKKNLGPVKTGNVIAKTGDFLNSENGGWSRHLHLQMLRKKPKVGEAPPGYTSLDSLEESKVDYPDPLKYFEKWKIYK